MVGPPARAGHRRRPSCSSPSRSAAPDPPDRRRARSSTTRSCRAADGRSERRQRAAGARQRRDADCGPAGGGAASGPASRRAAAASSRARRWSRGSVDGVWQELTPAAGAVRRRRPLRRHRRGARHRHAWAAVRALGQRASTATVARVAHSRRRHRRPTSSSRPAAPAAGRRRRSRSPRPNDGWLVTNAGWLFHYTDGTRPAAGHRSRPSRGTITFRPNEAAEQFVPDAPPVDDSELFKPPPLEVAQPPPAAQHAPAAGAAAQGEDRACEGTRCSSASRSCAARGWR